VQWLSDNGSIFAAHKTIEIAVALNLVPCFTPVESPESNGMAEAFVKTLKRDYVRVSPIPDAAAALALVDSWMDLLRKSGEFPVINEELDDTATTVYEGVYGGSRPPGANQRANAARDRR
jgi:hypothetical protein